MEREEMAESKFIVNYKERKIILMDKISVSTYRRPCFSTSKYLQHWPAHIHFLVGHFDFEDKIALVPWSPQQLDILWMLNKHLLEAERLNPFHWQYPLNLQDPSSKTNTEARVAGNIPSKDTSRLCRSKALDSAPQSSWRVQTGCPMTICISLAHWKSQLSSSVVSRQRIWFADIQSD